MNKFFKFFSKKEFENIKNKSDKIIIESDLNKIKDILYPNKNKGFKHDDNEN